MLYNFRPFGPVLLAALTILSGVDDERLSEARQLLNQGGEESAREATNLCVQVNDADAAELMLDVLDSTGRGPGLPAGHYRDIVWEGLADLTDPYARARIEFELNKNKKNAWTRAWAAELLGLWGEADWAQSLTKALKDKDLGVRASAAEALGRLNLPQTGRLLDDVLKALAKVAKGKDSYGRANALIALMSLAPDIWNADYMAALHGKKADPDGGVRCALLGALSQVAPGELEATSARALDDEDWRVRLQAVDNLAVVRSKAAIDRLIDATEDSRPTIRLRSLASLRSLTGQAHRQTIGWRTWWQDSRETFELPEGNAGSPVVDEGDRSDAVYNGLRVSSDHVAFLIDKSHAMQDELASRGMSKDAVAHEQLSEVLTQLPGGVLFNVYTYELEVATLGEKGALELDKRSVKKALDFVAEQRIRGSKDIWKVLELVVADPDIDTIYLLSSGEPDTGKYVHWNRVTAHLKDLNRFHKVTVHTIAYSDSQWYRDQLEKIAEATGGEFKWFQ